MKASFLRFLCESMNFHPDSQLFQVAGTGDSIQIVRLIVDVLIFFSYSSGVQDNIETVGYYRIYN